MRKFFAITIVVALAVVGTGTQSGAGEVVGIDFLNKQLASKPAISYERTVTKTRQTCGEVCHFHRDLESCREQCRSENYTEVQGYADQARVASTEVVEVKDLVFEKARLVALPEKALLATQEYQNCADATLSSSVSLSVAGTHGYTFTKIDSVMTTLGGSVGMSFTTTYGSLSTAFNVSRAVTISSQTSETFSETVSRNQSASVSIGPRKQGKIELLAFETTIEIPYSANVTIDGSLNANKNGLSKASQLLNSAERTLPFRGVLRITDVSQGLVRTTGVPGAPACSGDSAGLLKKEIGTTSFPARGLTAADLSTFKKPGPKLAPAFVLKPLGSNDGQLAVFADEGPGVAVPDGPTYQVLYTTELIKPSPACGYNDAGFPNNANYSVEAREYTSYSKGTIVSRSQESVETFKNCAP